MILLDRLSISDVTKMKPTSLYYYLPTCYAIMLLLKAQICTDPFFHIHLSYSLSNAVLPHRTFLKVLYFFFTISRFCTFFVLFSGLVLFLYFFFINLAEFYQILFKSTVFVLFLENLQNECFAYL